MNLVQWEMEMNCLPDEKLLARDLTPEEAGHVLQCPKCKMREKVATDRLLHHIFKNRSWSEWLRSWWK